MAEHTLDKPAEFLTYHQQRLSMTGVFCFKNDANQDGQKHFFGHNYSSFLFITWAKLTGKLS